MTAPGVHGILLAMAFSLWGVLSPFLQPGARDARAGKKSYERGEWVEALDRFGRARRENPDPTLDYDLGAAAYRAGKYDAAAAAFGAGRRAERLRPGTSTYNRGNALYRGGKLQQALQAYREALRADPDNENARYNYELTLRRLQSGNQESKKQQKSRGQKGQDQENRKGAQKQQNGQEKQDQRDKSSSGKNQAQPSASDSSQAAPVRADSTGTRPDSLLTPQQAIRLLNQITPEERELLKARLKPSHRRRPEKDW